MISISCFSMFTSTGHCTDDEYANRNLWMIKIKMSNRRWLVTRSFKKNCTIFIRAPVFFTLCNKKGSHRKRWQTFVFKYVMCQGTTFIVFSIGVKFLLREPSSSINKKIFWCKNSGIPHTKNKFVSFHLVIEKGTLLCEFSISKTIQNKRITCSQLLKLNNKVVKTHVVWTRKLLHMRVFIHLVLVSYPMSIF